MIGELEDERRWSRLREGILAGASSSTSCSLRAITWLPTYIFKVPKVIDPSSASSSARIFTYLDCRRRSASRPSRPKPLRKQPLIDKKTLDEMNGSRRRPPPPPPQQQAPGAAQAASPRSRIPPNPESQVEAPRPSAVPAKPNFAMGSAESRRPAPPGHAERHARPRPAELRQSAAPAACRMHPGAGTGGSTVLSDTQGVDFSSWLARWHYITQLTWDPLIPDEVNPPILKSGVVAVRFKVLPNGQVTDMQLDGRSGDTGLDRAAWGAITGSSYPPLPREFHGPYLELRAYFLYNMEPR